MEKEIFTRIAQLKKDREAVILVHNYQLPEVQDLGDFVGDSLELSLKASSIPCKVLVFCGVRFMAETAKILSPEKVVLHPVPDSGCPMADMISRQELLEFKAKHPGSLVVCYVNSTAEVKAECDIAVTSANAERIVNSLPLDKPILFVPDMHLGAYVRKQTGREMVLWPGYCPTHANITPDQIRELRKQHPEAKVLVHPECPLDVIEQADAVLSTGGMCRFVRESACPKFIIATEIGIIHRLKKENPRAVYIPVSTRALCPNMKKIRPIDILSALESLEPRVELSEDIRRKAEIPIRRMVAGNL
ncbi:MAG: quinolinate synthase NadA [Spirochaetales bacterium]